MVKKLKNFYITTSIMYTNAKPHIGFALELIQADVISRWKRLNGIDVFFLTGSDENGIKNQRAAEASGKDPQKFVDENTQAVIDLIKILNISNDDYIRTTDKKRHWPTAQTIWNLLVRKGDIYKKKYKGYYCSGCESFKTEKELENGICPLHNKKPEIVEEENYFFKLSKYEKLLSELIEKDVYKVAPEKRKNEILSFIKSGLDDTSFSRDVKALKWGIPVPGDSSQTMYVWCDALTNYLSGIGYPDAKFKKYWPADIHIIGKDIIRFHAVFWPAMLISAGITLPKKLFVHGFITSQGRKMSKTLGNVIDPFEQIKRFGADEFRYFLLREIPSTEDGDYTEEKIIKRINSDLADGLGNLVNRSIVLAEKYFNGKVCGKIDKSLKIDIKKIDKLVCELNYSEALTEIWKFISELNKYVTEKEPWKIKDKKKLENVVYNLLEGIRITGILVSPFMPSTSEKIFSQLGVGKQTFSKLKFGAVKKYKVKGGEILFRKIV